MMVDLSSSFSLFAVAQHSLTHGFPFVDFPFLFLSLAACLSLFPIAQLLWPAVGRERRQEKGESKMKGKSVVLQE